MLSKEADDPNNLQRIYNNLASTLADADEYERAREIALEGLAMARRRGGSGWAGWISGTLAEISFDLGDLEDAENMAREALDFALRSGDAPLTCMRYGIQAWVLLSRGKLEEAERAMGESLALLTDLPEPQVAILLSCPRADLARARGRHDEALAILREGAKFSNTYNVDQTPLVVLQLIRELVERGERDEATGAREILARGTTPGALASCRIADGLLTQDHQEAVALLREACAQLEEIGLRLDLIRGLLDLGRAERARRDRPSRLRSNGRATS